MKPIKCDRCGKTLCETEAGGVGRCLECDDEGDGDRLLEWMSGLRHQLHAHGYTPDLDADLERAARSHPIFFADLVNAGLVQPRVNALDVRRRYENPRLRADGSRA